MEHIEKLAFIGGFRSGSTLLINLLGLHPSVSAWYETKCLCEPLRWMKLLRGKTTEEFEAGIAAPGGFSGFTVAAVAERMRLDVEYTAAQVKGRRHNGKADHERYPIGADNVCYTVEEAFAGIEQWRQDVDGQSYNKLATATGRLIRHLGNMHKCHSRDLVLINKTPEMPRFGEELRACLGQCRIVNLIRDGREVAASAAGLGWGDESRMATHWAELILQSRAAAAAAPENYLEVRYEDFVSSPVTVADQVFQFFNLESLGKQVVQSYELSTGVKISPGSRVCDSTARTPLNQMPASAQQLLAELGYVDASPESCPVQETLADELVHPVVCHEGLWRKLFGFIFRR